MILKTDRLRLYFSTYLSRPLCQCVSDQRLLFLALLIQGAALRGYPLIHLQYG